MPDFTRIYFDTNILMPGWPDLSARIVNVLDLASSLGVEIVFPQVTIAELEKHWLEGWSSQRNTLLSATGVLKKLLGAIALAPESIADPTIPTAAEILD